LTDPELQLPRVDEIDSVAQQHDTVVDRLDTTLTLLAGVTSERDTLRARVQELLEHTTSLRDRTRERPSVHVRQFHAVYGQPVLRVPTGPTPEVLCRRLRLVTEEYVEFLLAHGLGLSDTLLRALYEGIGAPPLRPVDLVGVAVEKTDLVYQLEGTLLEYGIDGEPIARLIHEANMKKAWVCDACAGAPGGCATCGGAGRVVKKDDYGKVIKSSGWVPADVACELARQGWRGP
jgi:predicted HAD superfamily Cof-like phosphohydrolase